MFLKSTKLLEVIIGLLVCYKYALQNARVNNLFTFALES